MSRSTTLVLLAFAAAPYLLIPGQAERKATPAQAQLATKVMTALRARCSSCHSAERPTARLDLSTPEGIRKGGMNGKLFEPGKAKESLLIRRLRGEGNMPQMPLGFAPFSEEEIQEAEAWINAGGHTDAVSKHWAYEKPVRPKTPAVRNSRWVSNPIDAFVLAKLESEGLKPSPQATKETLIRRVSLDLTGLPPTVEEVDAFLADSRPDAYERLVDRLLASPHYGERQARIWMDLARYADTDGYEKDLRRTAWLWRDWVINAYNANMPFDEFTIEQIAGDQLPSPSIDQLVATGFHRNTMMNLEGGVDQEEAHFNVVLDRVNTTSTVWLGSSLACARCHDHKYDPFSQKDYYKMAAFFSNAAIIPRGPKAVGEEKWYETSIPVPSPEQVAKKGKLQTIIREADRELSKWTPELQAGFEEWLDTVAEHDPWARVPSTASSTAGAKFESDENGFLYVGSQRTDKDTYKISLGPYRGTLTGFRIEAATDSRLPSQGPGRNDNGNFVISGVKVLINGSEVPLAAAVADFSQDGFGADRLVTGGAEGWAIAPQTGKPHEIGFRLREARAVGLNDKVEVVIEQQSNYRFHTLGKFRVTLTALADPLVYLLPEPLRLKAVTNAPEDEQTLRKHFAGVTALLEPIRSRRSRAAAELEALNREIPTALIMRDKPNPGPLTANLRNRGEFMSKEELLTAATPSVLPSLPKKERVNRLDLAKWLVSKDNPLTARVQVNRYWEQYFGRGIVETTEDLGTQSAERSHPELLDWLATEFMRSDWDMKAMHKLIVMSSTYRQSSNATQELLEKDPSNVLLARGPRFRMEAEMIRDTALRASGLLNPKIGGPSVFPYQPEGVWDSAFISERWVESPGGDNYRRGLYTFWKRTMPYASFIALDTASREECSVRRIRTNTPLQALALLNDQATFAAAKKIGERMDVAARLGRFGAGVDEKDAVITYAFRSCTSRKPTPAELKRLKQLYQELLARYSKDPEGAKKIADTPSKAAWTLVGNVLLNLDETITKG